MQFMVIETFKDGCFDKVYKRFNRNGRMMPDGMSYIKSWVTHDEKKCYQIIECETENLIPEWTKNWDDIVEFEFSLLKM